MFYSFLFQVIVLLALVAAAVATDYHHSYHDDHHHYMPTKYYYDVPAYGHYGDHANVSTLNLIPYQSLLAIGVIFIHSIVTQFQ